MCENNLSVILQIDLKNFKLRYFREKNFNLQCRVKQIIIYMFNCSQICF